MQLDGKVQSLIAVGASIGANCKPCLQSNIALALRMGAEQWEIEAAIALGRTVKTCAAEMERLAQRLNQAPKASENETVSCCESKDREAKEGQNEE